MIHTRPSNRPEAPPEGPACTSRVVSRHREIFLAAPGEVFPLACPVAEYDWIDG